MEALSGNGSLLTLKHSCVQEASDETASQEWDIGKADIDRCAPSPSMGSFFCLSSIEGAVPRRRLLNILDYLAHDGF